MENSPLNQLPPELRNEISEMVLYHGEINLHPKPSCRHVKPTLVFEPILYQSVIKLELCKRYLALAQTCKQLRAETLELFYDINTFTYADYSADMDISKRTCRLVAMIPSSVTSRIKRLDVWTVSSSDRVVEAFKQAFRSLSARPGMSINLKFRFYVDQCFDKKRRVTMYNQYFDIDVSSSDRLKSLKAILDRKDETNMPGHLVRAVEEMKGECED